MGEEEDASKPVVQGNSSSDTTDPAPDTKRRRTSVNKPVSNTSDSEDDEKPLVPKGTTKHSKSTKPIKEESNDSDDEPIANKPSIRKIAPKKEVKTPKRKAAAVEEDDDDSSDDEPLVSKGKKGSNKGAQASKKARVATSAKKSSAKGKAKKDVKPTVKKEKKPPKPEEPVFKWWEEKELPEGQKWRTLVHHGPLFPPDYEPLPKNVYLLYDKKPYPLSPEAEEVAGFYASMQKTDYIQKKQFNDNFWKSWRELMTKEEKQHIQKLSLCDFSKMTTHYEARAEQRRNAPKEHKKSLKEAEEKIKEKFGWATLDGHKQKVGNFRLEPPGLFRGRGEHPKMGLLKKRLRPEDIIINIGDLKDAPKAPEGHKWKEVRSDNTVTWMASWTENIQGQSKYIMFNADSYLKGRNDLKKYELARGLKKEISKIRADYTADLKSKVMLDRQRATALYFIDKLALRAGGEKDTDEEADTVGCCNLRVEHVKCLKPNPDDPDYDEKKHKVLFDFLGKDSIRYLNEVAVSHQVYKNIEIFQRKKDAGDDLFDRLAVPMLNKYLQGLMPGLTAKVFRTYNASITLQEQLKSTPADGTVAEKMLAYNRANREVAVLCNHQRAVPKGFEGQMDKVDQALADIKKQLKEAKSLYKKAKAEKSTKDITRYHKKIETLKNRLHLKEIAKTDKEENKSIALGTSKLNYLDPRISCAWTMQHEVPIEKVYNATQRAKFRWAIEMTHKTFVF
eukprot:m.341907 g.341907  ORF g.341907 m.341907 type:complete len:732 (-) comp20617_c0_seq1:58-2253(-)